MPPRSIWPMADQLLDGQLDTLLMGWRSEGLSFESIARKLGERGIEVTGETVRQRVREIAEASAR